MAGIKALTDIGAGAAQVFDLNPMIDDMRAYEEQRLKDKQAKEDKIIESALDYDPSDIWTRDLPVVSKGISGYEDWVASNYERLNGSGEDRILAWSEKKQMENKLRNTIAASKQAAAGAQKLSSLIFSDPETYNTPENRELLANFSSEQPAESYDNLEAFNVGAVENKITAQANLKLDKVLDQIADNFFSSKELRTTNNSLKDVKRSLIDPEGLNKFVDSVWELGDNVGGVSAAKIQGKFKTKEAFKEWAIQNAPKNVDIVFYNPATGSTSGRANKPFEYTPDMSGTMTVGAQATAETEDKTITQRKGLFGWKKSTSEVDPADIKTEAVYDSEGNATGETKEYVLDDKNRKIYVDKSVSEKSDVKATYDLEVKDGVSIAENTIKFKTPSNLGGYDMIGGTYNENLFETATGMEILNFVNAKVATKPMYVTYDAKDSNGNTIKATKAIKAGEVIPKGAAMFIDSEKKQRINPDNEYQYTQTDLYATVQSANLAVREGENAEEGAKSIIIEQTGNQSKTKGMIKYSVVKGLIGSSLGKYPGMEQKIAEMQTVSSRDRALAEARKAALTN